MNDPDEDLSILFATDTRSLPISSNSIALVAIRRTTCRLTVTLINRDGDITLYGSQIPLRSINYDFVVGEASAHTRARAPLMMIHRRAPVLIIRRTVVSNFRYWLPGRRRITTKYGCQRELSRYFVSHANTLVPQLEIRCGMLESERD